MKRVESRGREARRVQEMVLYSPPIMREIMKRKFREPRARRACGTGCGSWGRLQEGAPCCPWHFPVSFASHRAPHNPDKKIRHHAFARLRLALVRRPRAARVDVCDQHGRHHQVGVCLRCATCRSPAASPPPAQRARISRGGGCLSAALGAHAVEFLCLWQAPR